MSICDLCWISAVLSSFSPTWVFFLLVFVISLADYFVLLNKHYYYNVCTHKRVHLQGRNLCKYISCHYLPRFTSFCDDNNDDNHDDCDDNGYFVL